MRLRGVTITGQEIVHTLHLNSMPAKFGQIIHESMFRKYSRNDNVEMN